jgi:non-specific serine/threonine protein kinase
MSAEPTTRRRSRHSLTARRREVAELVLEALSDREIAERLGIAHKTAERHTQHLRDIYGARNRVALALTLQRLKLGAAS